MHEGSHAVTAKAHGTDVTGFHPYPHSHDERPFSFGDTHLYGNRGPGERALTSAAPMFLDTAILGAYGGLVLSNSLPKNRYAQMAMFVFAAGHWVDMANHIITRNENADTRRLEKYFRDEHGLTGTQSILAVRGSFLYKGFRKVFKDTTRPRFNPNMTLKQLEEFDKKEARLKQNKKKSFFEQHELYVAPGGSGDGPGVTMGGRF